MKKDKKKEQGYRDASNDNYEKLRDELFDYRVEIKSYQRSIKTIIACASIVIAIIGYFGYDKIDSVVDKIEDQTNARLASTDSILSRIDTHYLDSLTALVEERTALYEEACSLLQKGMEANRELFKTIISNMDYNTRKDYGDGAYYDQPGVGLFDVVFYTDPVKVGVKSDCYVVLNDNVGFNEGDAFLVEVCPKGRNLAVYYQHFEIKGKYNKLPFVVIKHEQYQEYILEIVLLKKKEGKQLGYKQVFPITMR